MSALQTEYGFTLPVGFVDGDGVHHREGSMRLATARDEIEPLRDARVRENAAYVGVLKLARVLTNVGDITPVTPALVEQLYAADFTHLQRLYEQLNSAPRRASAAPPSDEAMTPTASLARSASRPPALAGVSDAALAWMLDAEPQSPHQALSTEVSLTNPDHTSAEPASSEDASLARVADALPIGVRQDRERALSRETLMRSATTPPRRGRVYEGQSPYGDALPEPTRPSEPEPTREPLMRLSPQPPAPDAPSSLSSGTSEPAMAVRLENGSTADTQSGGVDMEDVYEEMIVRLRRELLVERERMGAPFGA